ncbi:MAG: DUF433 domain-containing protein [Desulfobacteraceae bacterium]|nr:DUF433 domain-containing protein [Desulfobacteraceae bacterium]
MLYSDRIEIVPKVCNGKPVIKGTRIPVSVVLECLAEDENWDNLLAGFPELTREDIRAALIYSVKSFEHAEIKEEIHA